MFVLNAPTKLRELCVTKLIKIQTFETTSKLGVGCKESQFYSLPFGQAVASML